MRDTMNPSSNIQSAGRPRRAARIAQRVFLTGLLLVTGLPATGCITAAVVGVIVFIAAEEERKIARAERLAWLEANRWRPPLIDERLAGPPWPSGPLPPFGELFLSPRPTEASTHHDAKPSHLPTKDAPDAQPWS